MKVSGSMRREDREKGKYRERKGEERKIKRKEK